MLMVLCDLLRYLLMNKTKKNKFPNEKLEYSDGSVTKMNVKVVKGWYEKKYNGAYHFTSSTVARDNFEMVNKCKLEEAELHIKLNATIGRK